MGKIKKEINKIFSNINSITLKPLFRKIIGWDEIDEHNNAIHYYLNNYFDICKFPKAEGLLRKVQLADAELLRIVTDILSKHNLSYWLDYGTLLGAVRHKGFIPWDDDLDIAMPREDYNIALEVLPKELSKIYSDLEIEFGKDKEGNIILGDEISPDSCRLWDVETQDMLDKELFRKGQDDKVMGAYEEVFNRLLNDDDKAKWNL